MDNSVIWLIEVHPLLRAGLRAQVDGRGFHVAVDAASIDDAARAGMNGPVPEIVVMDFCFGPAGLKSLKQAHQSARVVVMAESAELSFLAEMFGAGADGYILKSISGDALVESLRLVRLGEKVFPSILTNFLGALQTSTPSGNMEKVRVGEVALSQRELDIIRSLADGQTNKSIAKELSITEATVKVHIKTVLRKLGATNRTQVAIWAVQHGLSNTYRSGSDAPIRISAGRNRQ